MRIGRYEDLAAAIERERPRLGPVRVVAVDGPAGSGKTTFAARLARALHARGTSVYELHTDDLLEGWADQVGFWPRLEEWVLEPLRRGSPGRFRPYDWVRQRFDDEWRPVPVPDVLVLEGVTSARRTADAFLVRRVFVQADRDLRLRRGIERDGEDLREEWVRWMAGEDRHFAADDTAARADIVVDGDPTLAHDSEREYVRVA